MKKVLLLISLVSFSVLAFSQNETIRIKHFNLKNDIAIQGYDPVSYFTQSKAVKGSAEFLYKYEGAIYQFSSKANQQLFIAEPLKYEPSYGGWCAYAMGYNGKKVAINPQTFKIVDGKLHLFYNAFNNNTLKSWDKDEVNLKQAAKKNWLTIISSLK